VCVDSLAVFSLPIRPFFSFVQLGHWVGSSVVHLGDHNVPNALSFIDKYTQVSRILNPIVLTIKAIPRLCERKDVEFYIRTVFGGPDALKMLILTDFFRSAFDGSGADNGFDAGSCAGFRRRRSCRLWASHLALFIVVLFGLVSVSLAMETGGSAAKPTDESRRLLEALLKIAVGLLAAQGLQSSGSTASSADTTGATRSVHNKNSARLLHFSPFFFIFSPR